jgi:hypothetical protein
MKRGWVLLCVVAAPGLVSADQVFLKGGRRITGTIVEQTEKSIALEVGPGRITLPMASVERVTRGASDIASYRERAARLADTDLQGWLELGTWARERDLLTQAREAYERVLQIDPQNAPANRAVGNVLLGDRWTTAEDSYRERGFVRFEGDWITPAERQSVLRERSEAAAAQHARAEADARVNAAETRARAAELDAERARSAAPAGSLPFYPYGYGGGHLRGHVRMQGPIAVPTPAPAVAPPPTRHPPIRDNAGRPGRNHPPES